MFLCRVFIGPGGIASRNEDALTQCLGQLAGAFADFNPVMDAPNHFVEFNQVDEQTVQRLEALLTKHGMDYDIVVEERSTDKELSAARYVPLLIEGETIDVDEQGNQLNVYEIVKCKTCLMVEADIVPDPYVVSEQRVPRVQDMYAAHNGVLIVSQPIAGLLNDKLAGCFQFGSVLVRESPHARRLKNNYVWMRAKSSVGREVRSTIREVCPTCGEPIEVRRIEAGGKFANARLIVEHFGNGSRQIALSGNWYGRRTPEKPMAILRDTFISGKLCLELLGRGVRGLVRPENVVVAANEVRC